MLSPLVFCLLSTLWQVSKGQGSNIDVLQNERYGPDGLGYYDYRFHTANGIYHEEAGNPLADDNYAVSGSYSYTSPEGYFIDVNYAADELGFRVDHSGTPGLPEAPPHALAQIRAARLAFEKKGQVYTNAYGSSPRERVLPHPGHLPQGLLLTGTDRLTAHQIHLNSQKLLTEERRVAERKRLELERKRLSEQQRLLELNRLEQERLALQRRLATERRLAEERRLAAVRGKLAEERVLAEQLRRQREQRVQQQRRIATQQRLSRERLLALERRLAEERRLQELTLNRRLMALQQQLRPPAGK